MAGVMVNGTEPLEVIGVTKHKKYTTLVVIKTKIITMPLYRFLLLGLGEVFR
jgi:hypothetical protein